MKGELATKTGITIHVIGSESLVIRSRGIHAGILIRTLPHVQQGFHGHVCAHTLFMLCAQYQVESSFLSN